MILMMTPTTMKVTLIQDSRANYLIMTLPWKVVGNSRTNLWWSIRIGDVSSRCLWMSSRMPSNLQRTMDPWRFTILSTNRKANHTLRSRLKTLVWALRGKIRASCSNFLGLFKVPRKLTLVVSVLDSLSQRRSLRSSVVRLDSRASGLRALRLPIGWNLRIILSRLKLKWSWIRLLEGNRRRIIILGVKTLTSLIRSIKTLFPKMKKKQLIWVPSSSAMTTDSPATWWTICQASSTQWKKVNFKILT